ncbi:MULTISPECIES: hypothetical protein [unclassified Thiocapsa]|uniref:hypothetical protein n=1 Tax=unclassified Thiocapsa TaxID=2641286 RepID=UPI0035B0F94F
MRSVPLRPFSFGAPALMRRSARAKTHDARYRPLRLFAQTASEAETTAQRNVTNRGFALGSDRYQRQIAVVGARSRVSGSAMVLVPSRLTVPSLTSPIACARRLAQGAAPR